MNPNEVKFFWLPISGPIPRAAPHDLSAPGSLPTAPPEGRGRRVERGGRFRWAVRNVDWRTLWSNSKDLSWFKNKSPKTVISIVNTTNVM